MKHKGIWMPIEVLQNKELTMQEKFVLMEIIQLTQLDLGCIANNSHFADLLQVSNKSISNTISHLVGKGYIKTEIEPGTRNHKRTITTIHPTMVYYPQKMDTLSMKDGETKDNKTINKTNNKYELFIKEIKSKVKLKSKVTSTKQGRELFKSIDDKNQLLEDYVEHHKEKGEFAKRLTAFMEDYDAFSEDEAMNELVNRYAR